MPRYIDADALKKDLTRFYDNEVTARELIDEQPTADVQPVKHGKWIRSDDQCWLTCPFCDTDVDVSCGTPFFYVDNDEVSHINFCPNCGAKMDGDIE